MTAVLVAIAKGKEKVAENEPIVKKAKFQRLLESPFVGSSNQQLQSMVYTDVDGPHVVTKEGTERRTKRS